MDDNKAKALAAAFQIEKQFGKGSIMRLGDGEVESDIRPSPPARWVSTSRSASAACPAAGSSKSTVQNPPARPPSPSVVGRNAEARRHRRLHRRRTRARRHLRQKLGVNVGDLLISQPDTGEQALEIADMLVRSGGVDVVVIDSVAALTPGPKSKARWATSSPACRPA